MKDILLLAAVSLFMAIGATLPAHQKNVVTLTLPEVQITAKRILPVKPQIETSTENVPVINSQNVVLPEVTITTSRLRKA